MGWLYKLPEWLHTVSLDGPLSARRGRKHKVLVLYTTRHALYADHSSVNRRAHSRNPEPSEATPPMNWHPGDFRGWQLQRSPFLRRARHGLGISTDPGDGATSASAYRLDRDSRRSPAPSVTGESATAHGHSRWRPTSRQLAGSIMDQWKVEHERILATNRITVSGKP